MSEISTLERVPQVAQPSGRARWRLSRSARRAVLLTHIVSSVSWMGIELVVLVLAVTALTSDDPTTTAACYVALNTFGVVLLLPVGLVTLATGVLLGLGSRWGVLRYRWVLVKLAVALVLTTLVPVALRPTLAAAARISAVVDGSLGQRLADLPRQLMFPPVVSLASLLLAAVLSVYKPWGMTRYGRRRSPVRTRRPGS